MDTDTLIDGIMQQLRHIRMQAAFTTPKGQHNGLLAFRLNLVDQFLKELPAHVAISLFDIVPGAHGTRQIAERSELQNNSRRKCFDLHGFARVFHYSSVTPEEEAA